MWKIFKGLIVILIATTMAWQGLKFYRSYQMIQEFCIAHSSEKSLSTILDAAKEKGLRFNPVMAGKGFVFIHHPASMGKAICNIKIEGNVVTEVDFTFDD